MKMITMEYNRNNIVWPVFDEDHVSGWFTKCRVIHTARIIPGMQSWNRTVARMNHCHFLNAAESSRTPGDDIRKGRLAKFSSIDELIADMDNAGQ